MVKFPELQYDFKIYFSNDTSSNFHYSAGPQITMEIIHQIKKIFVLKLIIIQKVKTLIFHCERKANPVKDNTETVPRRLLQKRCSANLDQISRRITMHCVKNIQIRSFFGPYFPAFELNTGK